MTAKHYVPSQHQKITLNKKIYSEAEIKLAQIEIEIKINMF